MAYGTILLTVTVWNYLDISRIYQTLELVFDIFWNFATTEKFEYSSGKLNWDWDAFEISLQKKNFHFYLIESGN